MAPTQPEPNTDEAGVVETIAAPSSLQPELGLRDVGKEARTSLFMTPLSHPLSALFYDPLYCGSGPLHNPQIPCPSPILTPGQA